MSNLSSSSFDHTPILSKAPEPMLFRRNTALCFERGKIFEVSPGPSTVNGTNVLTCRPFIVVGRRGSAIICLPLQVHAGIKRRDLKFLRSRILLYSRGRGNLSASQFRECPCKPLGIDLEADRELQDDVWIKIEEPYTLKSGEIEVVFHGILEEEDFETLRKAYVAAQDRVTDSGKWRQSTVPRYMGSLWTCVKEGLTKLF